MILVTGQFRIPSDALPAAREAMERVIAATRLEHGCLSYSYAEDVVEPGLFRVSESWTDRPALDAHLGQPHMKLWQEERARFGMTDREVFVHQVSSSKPV